MANDDIPPRPVWEFDFSLPKGVEDDEAANLSRENSASMERVVQGDTGLQDDGANSDRDAQQPMVDTVLPPGFSDDESGDNSCHRSSLAQRVGLGSPSNKKSPKRSGFDVGQDEESPRIKKPRQSLFGGTAAEGDMQGDRNNVIAPDEGLSVPETPRRIIQTRMLSLTLEEQEAEAQDDRPINLGFNLDRSDDENTSPAHSRAQSRAQSEESVVIPPDNRPAYDLRQNVNRGKISTYIDTDNTGDYDPAHDLRTHSSRMQRAKNAKKNANSKGKSKGKTPKPSIPKFIVRLRIKESFGNVRNITNDEDHWTEGWSEPETDTKGGVKEKRLIYRCNTPGRDTQDAIEDPSGDVDDLTGYPSARGCHQCRKLRKVCSMTEGGTYPCDQCDIQGEEDPEEETILCEPILVPIKKGFCKQCLYEEIECSFETDPTQPRCENCAENEWACEALPPDGYKTPRCSFNDIMYSPDRKHLQCTACRSIKKKCSLKSKTDKPPCKHCKKNGLGCVFYDVEIKGSGKKSAAKKKDLITGVSIPNPELLSPEDLADMMRVDDEEVMSREVTPEITMEDEAGKRGVVTKITTSFSHPIKFDAVANYSTHCNFCHMPWFGFVGHFERTVHVMKWDDGLGYTELGGGHSEDKGPTNMCVSCTYKRLQIILCPDHNLESIPQGIDQDFDTVSGELFTAEYDVEYQLQRWCSMCFSIATFGCNTSQPLLVTDDEEVQGCGVRLCNNCMQALQNQHLGDLQGLVAEMQVQPKTRDSEQNESLEGKTRADVELLSGEGLLMKFMNVSMEENENIE